MPDNTENIHEGHRKSVRERYIKSGSLEGYADHQILEMLLFYAIKRRDVNPLAHRLINRMLVKKAIIEEIRGTFTRLTLRRTVVSGVVNAVMRKVGRIHRK